MAASPVYPLMYQRLAAMRNPHPRPYCAQPRGALRTRAHGRSEMTDYPIVGTALTNDLCEIGLKRAKAKLTTNSPTKIRYWRVIGGHSVTEWETNWLDSADSWRGFSPLEQFRESRKRGRPERGPMPDDS
jgi:hypothetical protein